MQQRYRLRKREILVTSRESTESTDECPPSLSHCLPRRSRWRHAYAGLAIAKGHVTRDMTRWLEIEQQFSPFLLKMAPCGVSNQEPLRRPFFPPTPGGSGYPERNIMNSPGDHEGRHYILAITSAKCSGDPRGRQVPCPFFIYSET